MSRGWKGNSGGYVRCRGEAARSIPAAFVPAATINLPRLLPHETAKEAVRRTSAAIIGMTAALRQGNETTVVRRRRRGEIAGIRRRVTVPVRRETTREKVSPRATVDV